MDEQRFDDLTRLLAGRSDPLGRRLGRRGFLAGVAAATLGMSLGRSDRVEAACPPDQVKRRGLGCVCKATGRPPVANGQCPCANGLTRCGDVCVDVAADKTNCGGCGLACGSGDACHRSVCRDGQCLLLSQDDGQRCLGQAGLCCGGVCQPVDSDPTNCGCGQERCPFAETCLAGSCSCSGGPSVAPYTCTPHSAAICADPVVDGGWRIVADTIEHVFGGCPAGYTDCVGSTATPDIPYDTCSVCCPAGTTCDAFGGFCRQ